MSERSDSSKNPMGERNPAERPAVKPPSEIPREDQSSPSPVDRAGAGAASESASLEAESALARGQSAAGGPFLTGPRIRPAPIRPGMSVSELIRSTFLAYNAARLREACRLLAERMLQEDVTVGLALSGALTPAGLGGAALNPLLRGGYIDWVISTGANLYHDTHFGLDLGLYQGSPTLNDVELRRAGVVRIYDVLFDYRVLLSTDSFYREMITLPPFQKILSSAEFHALAGKFIRERERILGVQDPCFLSTAWECGVPVYTSSPGDSSIGMNVAAAALTGSRLTIDPSRDVNETAAIVLQAKRKGKSAVWILGGGSPKNFILQTEPQIQEVLGIAEDGHDYFLQITDARPDTGGLSGATPAEAVSWGKVDPDMLPHAVVAYVDSTIALPLLTAYVLENVPPRPLKRLFDHRDEMLEALREAHHRAELERQQTLLHQRVQHTQAQIEARFHQTQARLEEKLREKQVQIEETVRLRQTQLEQALREKQSLLQTEMNRMQRQVQDRVQKILPQTKPPKKEEEGK
jgi:deoxyhypusine synthase